MTATPQTTGEFPPGYKLGGFVIEDVAGRGAMGVVYRAAQPALGRLVALKVIAEPLVTDAAFRERFEREARAAAALGHPNIVSVHEAGQIDDTLYIAMQWVDGGDLRHHIGKTGPLPAVHAARVVTQIADALDVAHAEGVLHRDVKPANILLRGMSSGLHAYLTDFGVTRPFIELRGATDTLTQSGHIVGTPGFLAPEQIEGRDVDGRADLYALGCVLFEALTGRPPFQRDTAVATLLAHTSAPRPLVSEANPNVGTAFDEVVRRALAIDRDGRYADGRELSSAIELALRQPQRLPPVTPLRHTTIDGLSTEIELPRPRRRLVVSLDEPEAASAAPTPPPAAPPTPSPSPAPTPTSHPATAAAWPPPEPGPPAPALAPRAVVVASPRRRSRGRTNATVLILALLLIAGAVVGFLVSRGGDEGASTTTDGPTPAAAVFRPVHDAPDERPRVVAALRDYAHAFTAHDASALARVLAPKLHRRAGGAPGTEGCRTTSTRSGALAIYEAQFPIVADYTLPDLRAADVSGPTDASAVVTTRVRITTTSGTQPDEVMRFVLQRADRRWWITTVEAPCT